MMTEELVQYQASASLALMPAMSLSQAVERFNAMGQFVSKIMRDGVDFGIIPGTGNKPTLLKPGAEKLTTFFGLSPQFVVLEKDLDWIGTHHDGEAFFNYEYKCQLWRGDLLVGEGIGSCNSWETKYRFRNAALKCPKCGAEAIIKGKAEYGGGWLCWAKKGGCGAKWGDGADVIENQPRGKVPNPNPADLVNTISKMAQKRALVAAVLIAVNASEYFTQDIEDMVIEGDFVTAVPSPAGRKPAPSRETAPAPAPKPVVKTVPKPTVPGVVGDQGERLPTNGNGRQWGSRPFSAETMQEYVKFRLSQPLPAVSNVDGQRKAYMSTLSTLTNGDAESQRLVIFHLFGKTSRGDLTVGEKSVILDWGGCKPPDYQPSGFAITEVGNVIKAARLAAGQIEMELGEAAEKGDAKDEGGEDKLELGDSADLTADDVEKLEF